MRILKYLASAILVIGLFTGCAQKNIGSNPAIDINVKNGKGAILVYRPHNSIWNHKRFNIYINGQFEDILMDKSHYIFNKKQGKYIIELREDVDLKPEIFKVEVQLKEGKIRYIKFGTQSIEGHLKLRSVKKGIAKNDYDWGNGAY